MCVCVVVVDMGLSSLFLMLFVCNPMIVVLSRLHVVFLSKLSAHNSSYGPLGQKSSLNRI